MYLFFESNFIERGPIEYKWFLNIWPTDGTLSDTPSPSQSEPGSNGNEGEQHAPQIFKTGALPSDAVKCHIQDTYE